LEAFSEGHFGGCGLLNRRLRLKKLLGSYNSVFMRSLTGPLCSLVLAFRDGRLCVGNEQLRISKDWPRPTNVWWSLLDNERK
jgi:hypothetical protein